MEFLPDGDHFIFFARTVGGSGTEEDAVCVSSLSDTTIKELFKAKTNVRYANGNILFMRDDVLMAQPFDAGSIELTGDAVPIAENVSYMNGWSRGIFTVSEKNHLLYRIGTISTGSQLVIYDKAGAVLDTLTDQQSMSSFAISEDQSKIAFDIEDEGTSESDIWIYDINRRIKSKFTFGQSSSFGAVWSPNGEKIVFSSDNDGMKGINIKNTYGIDSSQLVIPHNETNIIPWDWTSDGKYIVYGIRSPETKADIFLYKPGGGEYDSVYLQTEFFEWNPRVSPDNRWVVYIGDESGKNEIYVSTFPNFSRKWQISTKGGLFPKWNDDGTAIYFEDFDEILHKVEVDGSGNTFRIGNVSTLFKVSNTGFVSYDLLDNGNRFLTNSIPEYKSISQCVLVLNWSDELKD